MFYHIIHAVYITATMPFLLSIATLIFCSLPQGYPTVNGINNVVNPEHLLVISKKNLATSLDMFLGVATFLLIPFVLGLSYRLAVKVGINSKGIRRMRRRWIFFPLRTSLCCKSWDQVQHITVRKDSMTLYMSWEIKVYFKEGGTRNITPLGNTLSIGIDNKSLPKFFEEIKKYAPEGIWQTAKISYNSYVLGNKSLF